MMLKNFRLIAAQSSPVSSLGQLDYREGWFAIIPVGLKGLQPELPSDETRRPAHLVGRLVEVPELSLTVGHVALGLQGCHLCLDFA